MRERRKEKADNPNPSAPVFFTFQRRIPEIRTKRGNPKNPKMLRKRKESAKKSEKRSMPKDTAKRIRKKTTLMKKRGLTNLFCIEVRQKGHT
tara:strand:+ start:183 stop:458 length:276 start_codon:yes stop_codon:yes gene_type:complete